MATRQTPLLPSTAIDSVLERVEDELALALAWKRPSIVLVVCGRDSTRRQAGSRLGAWLEEQGQRVEKFRVNAAQNSDVPLRLSRKRLRDCTVYFVEGLARGGEAALRALNVRREYFVDREIRAVFWLDREEEKSLAQSAPDFWAFRHRVVYLP